MSEMDVGKNVNTMVCEKRYDGVACKLVGVSTVLCGAPGSLADAPTVRDLLEPQASAVVHCVPKRLATSHLPLVVLRRVQPHPGRHRPAQDSSSLSDPRLRRPNTPTSLPTTWRPASTSDSSLSYETKLTLRRRPPTASVPGEHLVARVPPDRCEPAALRQLGLGAPRLSEVR